MNSLYRDKDNSLQENRQLSHILYPDIEKGNNNLHKKISLLEILCCYFV